MDSMDTSRLVGVGALVLLSLTILLTLIQHPVFTLALILIFFWLFLHPSEAEKFWRSAAPVLVEAFTKAVQQANASVDGKDKSDWMGKSGPIDGDLTSLVLGGQSVQAPSDGEEQQRRGDHVLGSAPMQGEHQSISALKQGDHVSGSALQQGDHQSRSPTVSGDPKAQNRSDHPVQNRPGLPPCDDPLLALDTLLALDDDDGDIEIDPMSQSDQLPKKLDQPDLLKNAGPPMPPPRPDKPKSEVQSKPQPPIDTGDQPDVIILNSPAQATYRRQFGGNGEDEFYVTSVDYEQFEFEPLIITEQVPKTTEYFEQLSAKKKRELMKDQEMRARLSRSVSRPPY